MKWTEGWDAKLRRRCELGETTAEIAAAFGVSRNSIIGRMHRLKISNGKGKRDGGKAAAAIMKAQHPKSRTFKFGNGNAAKKRRPPSLMKARMKAPVHRQSSQPCTLLDLRHDSCRWILNDDVRAVAVEDVGYCNGRVVEGCSWCADHYGQVYGGGK